jgi:superfamily I DNA and/or RNA helicase
LTSPQYSASNIGWSATAGSIDKNILISELQVALQDEIAEVKKQSFCRKTELFDGRRIYSSSALHVYRFFSDDADDWRYRKQNTEVNLDIEGEEVFGRLDSADRKSITIALEVDKGELVVEATLQDNSIFLLERVYNKLERIKNGDLSSNTDGGLKLFGLKSASSFPPFALFNSNENADLNFEQQIAILKSLSQEVTFIWGPPGTGKTKTLISLIALLIKAGKKVLVTTNTNAALDEILKKFIDNQQNDSIINDGKILRLGIPTFEHEKLDYLLPDKRLKKKISELESKVNTIQQAIDRNAKRRQELEIHEKTLLEKIKVQEEIKKDHESIIQAIENTEKRISEHNGKITNKQKTKLECRELLEKNQHSNFIKKAFSGVNEEDLENQIKILENDIQITSLVILSERKKLEELRCKKESLLSKLDEPTVYDNISKENWNLVRIRQYIADLKKEEEQKNAELNGLKKFQDKMGIMNEAFVIGTTIARASIDPNISQIQFDTLILDEASMALLPNIFFLAGLCSSNYVISGDFRQLSPIAQSKSPMAQKWLRRDIFSQAGIVTSVDHNQEDNRLVMLREQYRMHPDICNLISKVIYDDKLRTSESVIPLKEQIAMLPPFENKALVFCDTATTDPFIARPKGSFSRMSPYSAVVSAAIALKCVEEGAKKGQRIHVGIVTPYKAQAKLIDRILDDQNVDSDLIVASTIHRFQGSERDCIIFDLVEGKPLSPGKLTIGEFKTSESGRLVNVAISRAKGKFILVGNSEYIAKNFSPNQAIPQLLEEIQQVGETVDSNITGYWPYEGSATFKESTIFKDASFTIFDQTNFYPALLDDINKAKSKIVIFSPFVSKKRVETLLFDFQRICQKGIPIYVITRRKNSNDAVDDLKRIGVDVIFASNDFGLGESFDKFHFKVALVDNSVVYYGSLNILAQVESSESMIAFRSKRTVSQLVRNFGIDRIIKEYLASKNYNQYNNTLLSNPLIQSHSTIKLDNLLFSDNYSGKQGNPVESQRNDNTNEEYISKEFVRIEPGTNVCIMAKARLRDLGVKLGFDCFVDYAVDNLLEDSLTRYISVMWMKGREIKAAFQVIEQEFEPEKKMFDIQKIIVLQAKEKYLVEVSSLNGSVTLTKANNPASIDIAQNYEPIKQIKITHEPFDINKIRLKYHRAYDSWSEAEDKQLIDEYNRGLKAHVIAEIHQRQRSGIKSRIRRMRKLQLIR